MSLQSYRNQLTSAVAIILAVISLNVSAASAREGWPAGVREIESPSGPNSLTPHLVSGPDGSVYLSWIEKVADKHVFRFAVRTKSGWSAPRTIAEGKDWFVNWADFPTMTVLPDKSLAAHWLVKNGPGAYSFDIHLSRSTDGGRTWSKSAVPHRDGTKTEHGFVSMFPAPGGRVAAIWLDGRKFKTEEGEKHSHGHGPSPNEMTLRFTTMGPGGQVAQDAELDGRVCECCQTSAALTSEGPIVVYRDRSEKEVRDISVVRQRGGQWTEPRTLFADNWNIEGCPVNGPAVAASDRQVAVAWFTGASDLPRVKVIFSKDAGATFGSPAQVDDGSPLGRVGVLMLKDGAALVVWLERTQKGAEVRARRVRPDGSREESVTIAEANAARASGFPRLAQGGNEIVFAWTEPGNPSRVRTAVVSPGSLK